jgi:lipopolysaccharide transport system ATP-binding protein
MSKKEIETKIHDIIEFSGCSRYIDTPVKRYSSGMTVRLGFAVAAFLDPDILVVDEVLAVGDAEFQKKAIGKIKSVSREHDRTVIFVSHNMDTVRSLCSRAILMKRGKIVKSGLPDDIIQEYLIDNATKGLFEYEKKFSLGDDKVKLSKASISSSNDESIFYVNSDVIIQLEIEILDEKVSPRCVINLLSANDILITSSICNIEISSTGKYSCSLTIPSDFLNNSIYQIDISAFTFSSPAVKHFEVQNLFTFEVIESNESFARQFFKDKWSGALRYNYKWQVSRI